MMFGIDIAQNKYAKLYYNAPKYVFHAQPTFSGHSSQNNENQISDETLKIVSDASTANGIVYIATRTKITKEQQEEMLCRFRRGESTDKIAKELNIGKSTVLRFINLQPDAAELKEKSQSERKFFTEEQKNDIVDRLLRGESMASIAKLYGCSLKPINKLVCTLSNIEEIKAQRTQPIVITPEMEEEILAKYREGVSFIAIAKELGCAKSTIHNLIRRQPNAKKLIAINKEKRAFFSPEEQKNIIARYTNGESCEKISYDYNCSRGTIEYFIKSQSDIIDIKEQHSNNAEFFTSEQKKEILDLYVSGKTKEYIAKTYKCSMSTISTLIDKQPESEKLKASHMQNMSFFTKEEREFIISEYSNGVSMDIIARKLGHSSKSINTVISKHPDSEKLKHLNKTKRMIISPKQELEIVEKYKNGATYASLAMIYGCSYNTIKNLIDKQSDFAEIKSQHLQNKGKQQKKILTQSEKQEIIELYKQGKSINEIAKIYSCSSTPIANLIESLPNAAELKKIHQTTAKRFTEAEINQIIERFKNGENCIDIAISFECSAYTIRSVIASQKNQDEITLVRRNNMSKKNPEKLREILSKYRAGLSIETLSKEYNCTYGYIKYFMSQQPDLEDIKTEHNNNQSKFNEAQVKDILFRKTNGDSDEKIARAYKCTSKTIWTIVQKELNKNKLGTTQETFWHKYETYTIKELKNRISEFVTSEQIEKNDEFLEIMYYLDEKEKYSDEEISEFIKFIRLLDRLEQKKVTANKVLKSQTIKNIYDLIDRDIINKQIYKDLCKEYRIAIDNMNSNNQTELAQICLKYIARDYYDENKISSMKYILNLITMSDKKSLSHKLVAYDAMNDNCENVKIKEAQKIYGKDSQEKIGQYIIFNQVLNGDNTYKDMENEAYQFVDLLQEIGLNKQTIIKYLIELEDYFNSDISKNNSLANFNKKFKSKGNNINQRIVDFYIDNIYKYKTTIYQVEPDKRYFGGQSATAIIYPEAKQSILDYKCNWDKHEFLIDTDKSAQKFASSAYHSTGIKMFALEESYAKSGYHKGEQIAEIKVTGFEGARLVAKRKNVQDKILEFRYFKPNGFHEEK